MAASFGSAVSAHASLARANAQALLARSATETRTGNGTGSGANPSAGSFASALDTARDAGTTQRRAAATASVDAQAVTARAAQAALSRSTADAAARERLDASAARSSAYGADHEPALTVRDTLDAQAVRSVRIARDVRSARAARDAHGESSSPAGQPLASDRVHGSGAAAAAVTADTASGSSGTEAAATVGASGQSAAPQAAGALQIAPGRDLPIQNPTSLPTSLSTSLPTSVPTSLPTSTLALPSSGPSVPTLPVAAYPVSALPDLAVPDSAPAALVAGSTTSVAQVTATGSEAGSGTRPGPVSASPLPQDVATLAAAGPRAPGADTIAQVGPTGAAASAIVGAAGVGSTGTAGGALPATSPTAGAPIHSTSGATTPASTSAGPVDSIASGSGAGAGAGAGGAGSGAQFGFTQASAGAAAGIPTDPGAAGTVFPTAPHTVAASSAVTAASAAGASTATPGAAQVADLPFAGQVGRGLASLIGAANGEHAMTITVNPDNLGPVIVRAHIGGSAIRVELFAPTDLGRDALRAILPELRRDLAQGGLDTRLDLSGNSQPDDSRAAGSGAFGAPGRQEARTSPDPGSARASEQSGDARETGIPPVAERFREEPIGYRSSVDVLA